ncbi:MAG: RnfABCDGE type electron transport complex subunit D [Bacteroidales bacterium]|nr:RnfABCDGE type electron transport complex subunit D [Bacteroidales bacterium]
MMSKLTISPSPHVHSSDSVKRNMYGVLLALLPALGFSLWVFGLDSLRVVLISIVSCVLIEFLVQKFIMKVKTTICDGSAAVTGLILAFNLPSNLDWWIIVVGALFAIGVCKMTFGGLGQNIVNPAIAGRVFLLVSFPAQMTTWPMPHAVDGTTGATPLAMMKEGLKSGQSVSEIMAANGMPSYSDMLLGNMGGSLGEMAAIALIVGLVILLCAKIITWHIPVSILATVFVFAGILNLCDPESYASPLFHLLTGGVLFGAIFMATDYVTSPMAPSGMIIYGVGIGILTVLIRTFGAYPEGVSFAILIMNIVTPLINTYCKPKRFGEVAK